MAAAEYQMLGMQFTDVADVNGKVDIGKLVGMPDIAAQNWGDSKCARIMTLNDQGGYDFFYFINDAFDANDNEVEGDYWTDADGYVLADAEKVTVGTGAWFYSVNAGNVTLSGGGVESGTIGFEESNYTMQSSPLPIALNLSNVTTVGLVAAPWGDSKCARIMTLNDQGGYNFFYFINDAFDADDNEVQGDIWTDEDGYVLTSTVAEVGEAFWCYASQVGTVTVSR